MMTLFFPEAFKRRKNGSSGERSNFGSTGRALSMGRVMMLRGSTDSPSSTTRMSSRSRKFSAPIASNSPTFVPSAPACLVISARKSRSRRKVIPSGPSHQLRIIAVGLAIGKSPTRYTFSNDASRAASRSAGKSLQCIVGRKASDFTQGLSARGRSFGCLGRLSPPTSKDGRYCYRLIHEAIASVSPFAREDLARLIHEGDLMRLASVA